MIPEEILARDPAILAKAKELSERRICRLCLSEVDALMDIDVVWQMKIVSVIPLVTIGSDKLPRFICEPCGKFVKRCFEFRQLCKKSEQLLVSYPLTGTWSGELAIPRWLHEEVHPKQVKVGEKRKADEELAVPQVGSVRVRSHQSMTMSLQSPTITAGSVEQTMQAMMVDKRPRQEVPTITPTASETTYAIPVIQSQPAGPQYPSSTLPRNSISQFSNRAIDITPVHQPPQKMQRISKPPILPNPGYIMQHKTPQLIHHLQSGNTNLNNINNMLVQLPSYLQPAHPQQQQHPQQKQHHVQVSFTNVSLDNVGVLLNQLQQSANYSQNQISSTFINNQPTSNVAGQMSPLIAIQPSNPMTPTRIQNYQQPSIPMTPTRSHEYQQPSIPMTPTRSQNYGQPSTPMTPTRGHTYYQQQHPPANQQPQQFSKPVNLWCHVCNFKFLTEDHYNFHIRKHSTATEQLGNLTERLGRLKTCRLCTAKMFPTQADLVQHLKIHEQVGLTKACDFCVKIFADEERRNEHYTKDHAQEVKHTLRLNDH